MGPFATLSPPGSAAGRSFAQAIQRSRKVVAKHGELAFHALGAADHHMIGASEPLGGHDVAGEGAHPALEAVADDRAADLLGDGEADALARVRILAVADEQDETGSRDTTAAVRGKEVGALLDRG